MVLQTIDHGEPWKYLPILNVCIMLCLIILIGVMMGYLKVFNAAAFVPHAVKFVFYVALPLHIFRGIGIGTDFYDDSFIWAFICAFLVLRAIFLVICFAWVILWPGRDPKEKGIGQVAVMWLSLTWISTVILGVPISQAVFKSDIQGLRYGLLSGISSFIFQLPFQLLFLECHALEQEEFKAAEEKNQDKKNDDSIEEGLFIQEADKDDHGMDESSGSEKPSSPESAVLQAPEVQPHPIFKWVKYARRRDVWWRIFPKLAHNPVIWGITAGFIISLSTVGPTYLLPPAGGTVTNDYVPGLGWIFSTLQVVGECVTPVSLFAMGLWMQDQGRRMFRIPALTAAMYMLAKLVIIPLIMVGLAKAFDLDNEAGRAAVLIATLPISMASFSLGSHYEIGEAVLSENVALGTILMLPTIVIWNVVMDKVGLYPIEST